MAIRNLDNSEESWYTIVMIKLRLTIELVPRTSFYQNLRNMIDDSEWDKLRRETYQRYSYKCGICNATGLLHCHEVWSYDDDLHVQELVDFIALCEMCHHVKHIGYAGVLAKKGKLDYSKVVRHFLSVNGCSAEQFRSHRKQAILQWKRRSGYKWKIRLSDYSYLIDNSQGL